MKEFTIITKEENTIVTVENHTKQGIEEIKYQIKTILFNEHFSSFLKMNEEEKSNLLHRLAVRSKEEPFKMTEYDLCWDI